jgi:general stress protein 26
MEEQELRKKCLQLIDTADAVYLTTIGKDGYPHTRVMGNLRNKQQCRASVELFAEHREDFLIYMLTGHSSAKMQQIRANPKVSVYFCNPAENHYLMLAGNVEELADPELKKRLWQDEWKMHWPGGPDDPEFILLRLLPVFAKGWYKEGPFEFQIK